MRPNVVLILVDDMGFSDIGCYGGEIGTPNIDGLAGRGVRLTNFYNTARCSPRRIGKSPIDRPVTRSDKRCTHSARMNRHTGPPRRESLISAATPSRVR